MLKKLTPAFSRSILVSVNAVWTKIASSSGVETPVFLVFRSVLIFLVSLVTLRKHQYENLFSTRKKIVIYMCLTGITSGVASILFYESLSQMPLFIASVMDSSLTLLFIFLISIFVFKDKKSIKFYIQSIILLVAIYIVITGNSPFELGGVTILGIVLMVIHGVLRAIEAHLFNIIPASVDNGIVVVINAVFMIASFAIYWIVTEASVDNIDWKIVLVILLSSITLYTIKLTTMYATRSVGVDLSSAILACNPAITMILMVIIFNESIQLIQVIAVLVSVGITVRMSMQRGAEE